MQSEAKALPEFPHHRREPCWPLVVIVGPTASGKSELAIALARAFHGEIVNCDSVQVFRHFDIGTAKVPESERCGIPHHLIDIAAPDELFTAGDYSRLGRKVIEDIRARGRLPLVAGGTGFYVRALLEGLFAGPARDEDLRHRLVERERARPGFLHRFLRRADPAAARRIHENDKNKLIRAVEVCVLERRPLTGLLDYQKEPLKGYQALKIGLSPRRDVLRQKIDERCRIMFERGLVEETRRILALGFAETCKPFQSLGYAQALRMVRGEWPPELALADLQLRTRRYAKRQWTWFRADPEIVWLDGFGHDGQVRQAAAAAIQSFLCRFENFQRS